MTKKRKNKKQHILHILHRSKGLILISSILFSFILIVASTYAWQTYSDEKLNRVSEETGSFDVSIHENFTTNLNFQPGSTHIKEVSVQNFGESPVLVRLSFYEFFLAFQHDYSDGEGNGNFAYHSGASGSTIELRDPSTWRNGNSYAFKNNTYLIGEEEYQSTIGTNTSAYKYEQQSSHEALNYRTLNFTPGKVFTVPTSGQTGYWMYFEGYFYYSDVLYPNEETTQLLKSVTLSGNLPNRYEGSLYQLIPYLEAKGIIHQSLVDWHVLGTPVETLYDGKLN